MSENDKGATPERIEIDYLTRFKELIQSLPQEETLNLLPYYVRRASSYTDIFPHGMKVKKFRATEGTPEKPGEPRILGHLDYLERLCTGKDTDKAYSDKDFRKRKLAEVTYFRLKGYAVTLTNTLKEIRQKDPSFHKKDISFETVCRVYDCDAQLRELLLRVLQRIEIHLRASMSNFHAQQYGPYGYLDMSIYDYQRPEIYNHSAFLKGIAKAVEKNKGNYPFVKHYLKKYDGIMPIWVLSELMSFGDLVHFYKNWTETARTAFLSNVLYKDHPGKPDSATHPEDYKRFTTWLDSSFTSWLDACRILRNVCAHCGQLYGRRFSWTPKIPREIPKPAGSSLPLWASVLAAEFLYPDEAEWKASVTLRLKTILHSVSEADYPTLRIGLGFPENWDEQLEIWWNM